MAERTLRPERLWFGRRPFPALMAERTLRPERLWFGRRPFPALMEERTLRPERLWFPWRPPALIAVFTLMPAVVVVFFMVVFSSVPWLVFSRERFTKLQRPCHSGDEKIETVFQRSRSADAVHVLRPVFLDL